MTRTRILQVSPRALVRPWFVVTLLCLIYALVVVAAAGDSLALVTIGTRFSENIPPEAGGTEGYDGQFVYFIAHDPSTAARLIANGGDVPAYRFQRVLLPALARVLAVGQSDWVPWSILVINLAALGAGTAIIEHLLHQQGMSRWYALGYGFSLGAFGAARLSLTEPLSYALVLGAVLLAQRGSWLWSAAVLALAALAKETALVFAGGFGLYLLWTRQWRTALLFGMIAGLPFLAWQIVLRWRLGAFGVSSGGALATGFEVLPFGGILRILTGAGLTYQAELLPFGNLAFIPTETAFIPGLLVVFTIFVLLLTPFAIFPTVWGLREVWLAVRRRAVTPVIGLLLANAGILLFVPFSTYREPLGILRFVVGLHITVLLLGAERRSPRILLNSTIYAYTLVLLLVWDFSTL